MSEERKKPSWLRVWWPVLVKGIALIIFTLVVLTNMGRLSNWLTNNVAAGKLLAVIVTGGMALYQLSRNSLLKNTVSDRREWRKKLREIAEKPRIDNDDKYVILANLNPSQDEDTRLKALLNSDTLDYKAIHIELYRLLKYDWERSKAETSVFFWWFWVPWADWKYKNK